MPDVQVLTLVLFSMLALWVPLGLTLMGIGASEQGRAEDVAVTALVALATAVLGYFACGFALQFGGAAFVSGLPGLGRLTAEWSPLDLTLGPGWGLVGLRGFFLRDAADNADAYLLFLSNLPAVVTATLVTLLALSKRVPKVLLLAIGLLVSGWVYPLFGNWVWGGGWLANLGLNQELGHGYVDLAGSGSVFLLGSLVALAGLGVLRPRRAMDAGASMPPLHFPLFMIAGALLAMAGWAGLALGNALAWGQVELSLTVLNLWLAAAGGALVISLYSWFVTGHPNALATARATVAGLVAVSAGCAFVPPWAALAIGASAGVLSLLGVYVWEQVLHLDDPSASLATFGLPGLWGLLAVGILANGRWGAGWNNVGPQEYLGMPGQGISGLVLAEGLQSAGTVQLVAQLAGLGALFVVAFLLPWVIFRTALWLRDSARRRPAAAPGPQAPPIAPLEEPAPAGAPASEAVPPAPAPAPATEATPPIARELGTPSRHQEGEVGTPSRHHEGESEVEAHLNGAPVEATSEPQTAVERAPEPASYEPKPLRRRKRPTDS